MVRVVLGQYYATDLEALTKLDQFRHTLVHVVLDKCLSFLVQSLLFVGHEIAERRNRVCRRLYKKKSQHEQSRCYRAAHALLGAGEGVLVEGTDEPSGPLTETLGTSALGALVAAAFLAPGGT